MIDVTNIRAGYGDVEILHDISFSLENNENLSIIGPNGCGKTTLLRTLAGTLSFSGEILLDEQDIKRFNKKNLAKKVSMLSQSTQIYFNYTVFETIMMGRYVHEKGGIFGGTSTEDISKAENAMKIVGVEQLRDRAVNTLSGGQLQRVLLAKIIAQDPDIILLDEPTNHLDLSYQVELIKFLKKWSRQGGKSVIGVLHDVNLAMLLSDNVLLMEEGKIKAYGNCKDVFASGALESAYKMDVGGYMLESLKKWENILADAI